MKNILNKIKYILGVDNGPLYNAVGYLFPDGSFISMNAHEDVLKYGKYRDIPDFITDTGAIRIHIVRKGYPQGYANINLHLAWKPTQKQKEWILKEYDLLSQATEGCIVYVEGGSDITTKSQLIRFLNAPLPPEIPESMDKRFLSKVLIESEKTSINLLNADTIFDKVKDLPFRSLKNHIRSRYELNDMSDPELESLNLSDTELKYIILWSFLTPKMDGDAFRDADFDDYTGRTGTASDALIRLKKHIRDPYYGWSGKDLNDLILYRVISAKDEASIINDDPGKYWMLTLSNYKDDTIYQQGVAITSPEKPSRYLLTGKTSFSQIEQARSLLNSMQSENEVTLKPNGKITIIKTQKAEYHD